VKRAACYLRVSTDEQTLENQRAPLAQLCAQRGLEPVWYEEMGSAAKRRPVFDKLMADAHAGRFAAVCVVALDRLGRSLVGVVHTVTALDKAGVEVIAVRDSWLQMQGPFRSLLLSIFAWVAQYERETLISRTKAGLDRARREGKTLGRPRASTVLVSAAADRVLSNAVTLEHAARAAGVSERTIRRELKSRGARRVPERPHGALVWVGPQGKPK
jgi:DNA invertase Pin-like site-specific DNA recombinase